MEGAFDLFEWESVMLEQRIGARHISAMDFLYERKDQGIIPPEEGRVTRNQLD